MEFAEAYPKAWENPVVMRASGALLAAGAWDANADLVIQNIYTAQGFTLSFTYTQGAAGAPQGGFDYQIQLSPYSSAALVPVGADEWVTERARGVGAVAFGADTQNREQRQFQTFGSQTDGAESFQPEFELQAPYERIRIRARESAGGDQPNPGTLQITMVVW